jgi:hypothetical protein
MIGSLRPIRWGRVFGALFMSLPFFVVLGGAAMNFCVNSSWTRGLPVRFDRQEAQLDIGVFPIFILVGAPVVVAAVGAPVAALLAAALRPVRRRWHRLIVHAAIGTGIGTVIFAGYSSYGVSRDLPFGAAAGVSTVLGILCADAICAARDSRRPRKGESFA